MSLSSSGIQKLESIITKRFNVKSIDAIAMCGNSNACELFWSRLVKYSQGKRLLGCGTDLWETMVELTFCMSGDGNPERTLQRMSQLLGIRFTEHEKNACKVIKRNRKRTVYVGVVTMVSDDVNWQNCPMIFAWEGMPTKRITTKVIR